MKKLIVILVLLTAINQNIFSQQNLNCGTFFTNAELAYLQINSARRQSFMSNYKVTGKTNSPIMVPLAMYVIRKSDGTGGITQEDIDQEIVNLNNIFAPMNIEFFQCNKTVFVDDNTYYDFQMNSHHTNFHNTYGYNPNAINIKYANTIECNGLDAGGCYTFGFTGFEGIVMRADQITWGGEKTAHEIGHYFTLLHTFNNTSCGAGELVNGSNCSTAGDEICDTDADPNYQPQDSDCGIASPCVDANGDQYIPPMDNQMSYYHPNCVNKFTELQFARMTDNLLNDRANLLFQILDGFELSTNTDWTDLAMNFTGNVIIPSGITLTVLGSTIKFDCGENTGFIVKRGGRLVIKNSTIDVSSCCNGMWGGIQVWGTRNTPQPILNQINYGIQPNHGVLRIYNSTIENAHEAIRLHRVDGAGNNIWDYAGGVVLAENSTFRNNRRCVEFISYEYNNTSYFEDCTFELTDALKDPASDVAPRITMWNVQGVNISKCIFQNTASTDIYQEANRGTGIYSIDAQYVVGVTEISLCSGFAGKNSFIDLYRGIEAISRGVDPGTNTLQINGNDFIKCSRSIGLFGVKYPSVNRNNFILPDKTTEAAYGIYLGDCNGYKVQENTMESTVIKAGSGVALHGIISQRSGDESNTLYKNTFTNVIVGNQIQENNQELQIDCSKFYNGEKDIVITSSGILGEQGKCEPDQKDPQFYTDPIANIFSASCDNSIFWHILTDAAAPPPDFNYNSNGGLSPVCYDNTVVTVKECQAGGNDESKTCPSLLSGCNHPPYYPGKKIDDFGGTIAILKKKIDGGDKPGLINFILDKKNTPQTVKGKLTGIGPYLSDEVLEAAINRANPLPSDILKEILLFNSPLTAPVMKTVEGRVPPMSTKDMKELKAAQHGESERSKLEREIRHYESQRQLEINELTRQYLMREQPDSIIAFLENENTIRAKKDLVELYMRKGNIPMAEYHLADIPSADIESENFVKMSMVALELKKQGKTYHELSRQQEMTIRDVASMNSSQEFRAKSVLDQVFGEKFEEPIEGLPGGAMFAKSAGNEIPNPNIQKYDTLCQLPVTYPIIIQNKQETEQVKIQFKSVQFEQSLLLVITDLYGKTLLRKSIENNGEAILITEGLKNGIYFYRIITSHSIVKSGKLVIVR